MDEINTKISDGSVGFLTRSGQLKSAKENAEAERKISESDQPKERSEEPDIDQSIGNALSAVRKRTNEDVNQITEALNTDKENLSSARVTLKELKQTAVELKQAIKNGDEDTAEQLRSRLKSLQKEQDSLVTKTEDDNRRLSTERVRDINVGNRQIGRVEAKEAQLERSSEVDTSDIKDLNRLIEETDAQLENVKSQLSENKESRGLTQTIAREARQEINKVEENSLQSLKDAEALADKLSTQLKQLNSGSLNLVHKNVSQAAVDALLRS